MSQTQTPQRLLGCDAIAGIAPTLAAHMPARRLLVVCDDLTWAAAGDAVKAQLAAIPDTHVHSFGTRIRAEHAAAEILATQAADVDALLAIGSGTINDITKYAAATAKKPYAVVATAASMNGYTSANASLEVNGAKQSFAAKPPVFVVGDTGILANAPKRLTRAGLGDTLCRTTVEADMLLSHHLFDTPYPRALFDILRKHEAALLPGIMAKRDSEAAFVASLMEALLDAGDAMTAHGSSAVASQGEHMIAHTLEMKYGSELRELLHGELIAITSLTMSQMQHRALLSVPMVKPMAYDDAQFERLFGKKHGQLLAISYRKKQLSDTQATETNTRIAAKWPEITAALAEIMLSTNMLERALIHSGSNTKPAQVGLADERYRFATSYAHLTRDRFTFLDIAAMNIQRLR